MLFFGKLCIALVVILYFTVLFLIVYGTKYRNPYRFYMVFGKKGSGKSTLIAKLCYKHLKKGWIVYSTMPVPGAYLFDPKDIGKISFKQNSVVFIDEAGMIFDNRDFKNFRNDTRDWFKLQRHYRVKVYVFSQAFDIDVKLRNLTDYMYLTNCYFNTIAIARRVSRKIVIVHASAQGESRIADDMDFNSILLAPFGGLFITWIPTWIKYFDSFDAPELPEGEFIKCEFPVDFEERTLKFKVVNWIMGKVDQAGQKILGLYLRFRARWCPFIGPEEIGDFGACLPSESTQREETSVTDLDHGDEIEL